MTLIDPATVERRVLANGLRVLVRRDTSAPVTAIVTYVDAGYFDETDDVIGIAHVLEHMYFKGTPTRGVGEIARQTKAVGGYLNAATIYDHTLYYAVVPSAGYVQALEVQADAYRHSSIDAGELARELEVIIQEAKRKADNPGAVTIETLYELLHDTHRIRRWRIGREDGLRRLTRDDLLGFYRNFYRPSSTVLVIVGDVDVTQAFAHVERLYGDLQAGEPRRTPGPDESGRPGFRYRELAGDITQTQWAIGWRTPGTLDPDTPALDVAAAALSTGRASRLYRAVRDRRLASGIAAYNYTPRDIGVFTIQAETPPETTLAGMETAWAELRRLQRDGLGTMELERLRRVTESRWLRRLENMEGQANYLAEWESLGNWELGERYYERLLTLTATDVQAAAQRHLGESDVGVLVYRPSAAPAVVADTDTMRARLGGAAIAGSDTTADPVRPVPAPAAALPRRDRVENDVHVYRLASGVPVLVRPRPGTHILYAGVLALGGASDENDDTAGRTLLMARTAVKGTERRSALQIAEAAELLGGSVSASVGGETVGWTVSVPVAHAAAAIELLADVAQHPTFASDALETERAVALADVAATRDDMYRFPAMLATRAAFAGHPYGVPVIGTEASLAAVTREALVAWHRERVLHASSVVVIVGDGDPDALAGIAARHFGELAWREASATPSPRWPGEVVQHVEQREKAQTAVVLTWPAPSRGDVDRFAIAMLSGIASGLGGRLFEELRDRQSLCYTVHAYGAERRVAGTFNAYIATSPEKEDRARAGLLAELGKFRDEIVSEEELRRAQTYALGTHAIRQQSGGAVLSEVADAWMFGTLAELTTFEAQVRAVTPEAIRAVARRYLGAEQRVEGIVRGVGKTV